MNLRALHKAMQTFYTGILVGKVVLSVKYSNSDKIRLETMRIGDTDPLIYYVYTNLPYNRKQQRNYTEEI